MNRHFTLALSVLGLMAWLFWQPQPIKGTPATTGASSDFYILYSDNYDDGLGADIFITSKNNTYGKVEIPGIGFAHNFTVAANTITTIDVPLSAEVQGSDVIANLGIRITANDDITVYFLNPGVPVFTNDAYVAFPVESLGTEYIAMSWGALYDAGGPSELAIVAPFNSTIVTIKPTITTGSREAGIPYSINLNQFQTYTLQSDNPGEDLTGTIIQSTAPIAVFSGNRCVDIPIGYHYCDHIVEQMLPVNAWGKSYVAMPMASRSGGDFLRIMASADGTTVTLNGTFTSASPQRDFSPNHLGGSPTHGDTGSKTTRQLTTVPPSQPRSTTSSVTINRGQFYQVNITGSVEISANQPVLVAQYGTGQEYGGLGDPLMMLVVPSEQFLPRYTFLTPTGYPVNYVNIVVPTSATNSVVLDGTSVGSSLFSPIVSSGFSGAAVPLSEGSHTIVANQPLAIYVYGFGDYVSYGYEGGLGTGTINPPPPPANREPIIIVPGLGGTNIVNDQGVLWLNLEKMCQDSKDHWWRPNSDFLDVTQLDETGAKPLNSSDPHYTSVSASNVITNVTGICDLGTLGKYPINPPLDVYQGLVDYLLKQGYTLGRDLFLFGYDWRRDITETSSQLNAFIDAHRSNGKVNIIAHSMGGLVSRNYILDQNSAAKVDNLFILGTPFLGTTQVFTPFYFGDDMGINDKVHDMGLPSFMWLINDQKVKQVIRNWPGEYEILPGQRFYTLYPDGYIQEDRDIDGDGKSLGKLNYDQTNNMLSRLLNSKLVTKGNEFHTQAFDGFVTNTYGVHVYLIVGVGYGTKERIRFWQDQSWGGLVTNKHASWWYSNGDGTVLQRSSDLHDASNDFRGTAQVYYLNTEHGVLPLNTNAQQQIMRIISGVTTPINDQISTVPDKWPMTGKWVEVNSPVDLHIYDAVGNHLGPTPQGTIEYGIPNAQYDVIGHDKSTFVSDGIKYTVVLTATGSGDFDLRLRNVQGSILTTALYKDIPVRLNSTAKVQLDFNTSLLMAIDQDGDGIFETTRPPTAVLDQKDSLDVIPPTSTITLDRANQPKGSVAVTISAADQVGGSGVWRIEYSLDGGNTFHVYTSSFVVNTDTVSVVYTKATDKAGNEQYPLSIASLVGGQIFLPFVGKQ